MKHQDALCDNCGEEPHTHRARIHGEAESFLACTDCASLADQNEPCWCQIAES